MLRHTNRAIHLDCLAEEHARLVAVVVRVPFDQHRRIPASHLWLGDLVGHLVRLAKGRLEMFLGRVPLLARRRGECRLARDRQVRSPLAPEPRDVGMAGVCLDDQQRRPRPIGKRGLCAGVRSVAESDCDTSGWMRSCMQDSQTLHLDFR